MTPVPYRVVDRTQELPDTATLVLEPVREAIPPARPGQFTMMYAFGVGEVAISYSGGVGTAPGGGPARLVHTIRSVGATSRALTCLQPGDIAGIRGPFGTDWGLDTAVGRSVVVVAGGIGTAPVRPAIEHLLARRQDYRQVTIVIGARTPRDLLYPAQLAEWRSRFDIDVRVTVDAADRSWLGHVGLVTQSLPAVLVDARRTTALVCGPEVMMRFVAEALSERGIPSHDIRVSMELNMQCAVVQCGHCQTREFFICHDGPVLTYDLAEPLFTTREL